MPSSFVNTFPFTLIHSKSKKSDDTESECVGRHAPAALSSSEEFDNCYSSRTAAFSSSGECTTSNFSSSTVIEESQPMDLSSTVKSPLILDAIQKCRSLPAKAIEDVRNSGMLISHDRRRVRRNQTVLEMTQARRSFLALTGGAPCHITRNDVNRIVDEFLNA